MLLGNEQQENTKDLGGSKMYGETSGQTLRSGTWRRWCACASFIRTSFICSTCRKGGGEGCLSSTTLWGTRTHNAPQRHDWKHKSRSGQKTVQAPPGEG